MNTKEKIYSIGDAICGAAWDLQIIENSLGQATNDELILVPDNNNDPVRMAMLALQTVRAELQKHSDDLMEIQKKLSDETSAA